MPRDLEIPQDLFFHIIEYVVPSFLSSISPEEINNNERLLLSPALVCKAWQKSLDRRFDFKTVENFCVVINGWLPEKFLSAYEKRMKILKKHEYDATWLVNPNSQINPYTINTAFNDKVLKLYLDNPFLLSCYFEKNMQTELNEFSSKGCEKFLFYINTGGFLSPSLHHSIFKYIYPTATDNDIDLCIQCKNQRAVAFFGLLSYYGSIVFLQKKLLYMLTCNHYITDDEVGPACKIVVSEDVLDYQLFLSNFINEFKAMRIEQTPKQFCLDTHTMGCFFEEYINIFTKKDKTGKSFAYYMIPLFLLEEQKIFGPCFQVFLNLTPKANLFSSDQKF